MTVARDTSHIDWSEYFIYDESSPSCLRWKVSRGNNKIKAGQVAGSIRKNSDTLYYWSVELNSIGYMVHRIVWEMIKGRLGTYDNIDHENGDGKCNKISNLLLKTHRANCQNKKKQCDNKSGITGVSFTAKIDHKGVPRGYWVACWVVDQSIKSKSFSVKKFGNEQAFTLAVQFRAEMIKMLNSSGMEYSHTHGCR